MRLLQKSIDHKVVGAACACAPLVVRAPRSSPFSTLTSTCRHYSAHVNSRPSHRKVRFGIPDPTRPARLAAGAHPDLPCTAPLAHGNLARASPPHVWPMPCSPSRSRVPHALFSSTGTHATPSTLSSANCARPGASGQGLSGCRRQSRLESDVARRFREYFCRILSTGAVCSAGKEASGARQDQVRAGHLEVAHRWPFYSYTSANLIR